MSLATRCTACGTIFRVVQDQLRVSEGWVRCGRCAEVFDAREQLFDMDREAPPPWPAPQAAEPEPLAAEAAPAYLPEPEPEPESEPDPPLPDRPIRARVDDHSDAADFPVSALPDAS
ncbi:MAG TPA: zinc-ribbon domain-containing protein, partial [Roseateles sp.]|nr:zinc-ribbon domain-containing protein [Roseateles sp.]